MKEMNNNTKNAKLIFSDPIRGVKSNIIVRKIENAIGIFFDLDDPQFPGQFQGGDCEINMTKGSLNKLSEFLIGMAELSELGKVDENNMRTVRFEHSDKNDEKYPKGIGGHVIILACIGLVEIIIHFDDPNRESDYTLTMESESAKKLGNLLQSFS